MAGDNGPGGEDGEGCARCGLCCRVFGPKIAPSPEDLHAWIAAGRTDILRHFSACRPDGSWVPCTDLDPTEIGDLAAVELRDPDTGGYPAACPFLRREKRSLYACAIHAERPEMCRSYMPWVFGETFFPRCRALEREEGRSFWGEIR
ncbi:MAG: YkgJ family cysteine cluster protein [Methanolinea sp.]